MYMDDKFLEYLSLNRELDCYCQPKHSFMDYYYMFRFENYLTEENHYFSNNEFLNDDVVIPKKKTRKRKKDIYNEK